MRRLVVCVLLGLAGCAGSRTGDDAAALVGVERLPAERRALLVAYGRGGDEWESARAGALEDPAATRFLVENLMLEMMRSYDAFAARTDERARSAFLRAQFELARLGAPAAPALVELYAVGDGVVAELASGTLVRIGKPSVPLAVPLLANGDPRVRRRGAALLALLPHAGAGEAEARDALRSRALSDSDWIVRAEAARSLGARGARDVETGPWRLALERALVDPDPAVRRSASEGLLELGDRDAIPALANALARAVAEGEVKLLAALESALSGLAGSPGSRTPQGWLDWWREQRIRGSER